MVMTTPMPHSAAQAGANEIRNVRLRVRLSQPQFATLLGVSAETYRTWDSGRRAVPDAWLDKARALGATNDPNRLWSLQELATELSIHVRTLRDAARTGRLDVVYENRVVFRNPSPELPWRPAASSWSDTTDGRTRDSQRGHPRQSDRVSLRTGTADFWGSDANSG